MREKTFENKIKDHLKLRKCYFIKFFANGFTKAGVPDILACINGVFLGIEVKAENGRPSVLQRYNVAKIRESGGYAVIAYPKQENELLHLIESLREGRLEDAREVEKEFNL